MQPQNDTVMDIFLLGLKTWLAEMKWLARAQLGKFEISRLEKELDREYGILGRIAEAPQGSGKRTRNSACRQISFLKEEIATLQGGVGGRPRGTDEDHPQRMTGCRERHRPGPPARHRRPDNHSHIGGPVSKTIVIGSDHGGYALKTVVIKALEEWGYVVEDEGPGLPRLLRLPALRGQGLQQAQGRTDAKLGILICGTGLGMSMTANRMGIRAALCTNEFHARMAREHNDARCICLGERVTGQGLALSVLKVFLETGFGGDQAQAAHRPHRHCLAITSFKRKLTS